MKILSIDVGAVTQDIMLYDREQSVENSTKLVVPSPTMIFANKIRTFDSDLIITGDTMGGGPINTAINHHLKEGYRVLMTERSARTIRDNLNFVKSLGVEIVQEEEVKNFTDFMKIELKDVDLNAIGYALANFNINLEFDFLGIGVQDHGFMEGVGDRNFRFMKITEKLDVARKPEEFAYYDQAPDYFTRINGVFRSLKGHKTTVLDSKFAAICGATCDQYVSDLEKFVAVDIGNGHTLAAAFEGGKIVGVFEHHTLSLDADKLEKLVRKLANGTLTHEEVHGDGGHGAWVLKPIDEFTCVVATGPRRKILHNTNFNLHYATPAGDVMMAGPVGLIKAIKSRYSL